MQDLERKNESGNVLFLILLAVVLIGALTAAIMGSDNSENSHIDKETLIIRVSEVQRYGSELERAVNYIMQNGYSEVDLRFAHPDAASAYGDITDTPARQIFAAEGGAATYRGAPRGIQTSAGDWIFSAENRVGDVGSGGCSGDSCADLVALLMNVTEDFCIRLNEATGMDNPSDAPPQDNGSVEYTTLFSGGFQRSEEIDDAGGLYVLNNSEGCFEGGADPAGGTFHYYRVLLAR